MLVWFCSKKGCNWFGNPSPTETDCLFAVIVVIVASFFFPVEVGWGGEDWIQQTGRQRNIEGEIRSFPSHFVIRCFFGCSVLLWRPERFRMKTWNNSALCWQESHQCRLGILIILWFCLESLYWRILWNTKHHKYSVMGQGFFGSRESGYHHQLKRVHMKRR